MNKKALLFLCLISLIFFEPFVSKNVQAQGPYFVSPDGGGTSCTQSAPCSAAQGIANAINGDSLYFKHGTYTGTTDWILSITKGVSLYGGWNGAATGTVILNPQTYVSTFDGQDARGLIEVNLPTGDNPVLIKGFLFTKGEAPDSGGSIRTAGGAILVKNGAVQIEGNQFVDNNANRFGGAIYVLSDYDVTILNNFFTNNRANYGGGAITINRLATLNPNIAITDNHFHGGSASYGTAIHVSNVAVLITRNLMTDVMGNSAIILVTSAVMPSEITNNVIVRSEKAIRFSNMATDSHKVWNNTIVNCSQAAIDVSDGAGIEVVNNIIAGSKTSIYLYDGIITGRNNLFFQNVSDPVPLDNPVTGLDPLFVDPANDNYHLQYGSPAIDAGAVVALTEDFDGDKRPVGSGYDIGADEFFSTLFLPLIVR